MLLRDEINSFLAHKDDNEKVIDVKKTDKEKKKKDSDVKTRNNTSDGPSKKVAFGLSQLSPALSSFLGAEVLSRGQVIKGIWDYIKEHNLQNPNNRKKILLDDKMRTIFKSPLDMFSITTQLAPHLTKIGSNGKPASESINKSPSSIRSTAAAASRGDSHITTGSKRKQRDSESESESKSSSDSDSDESYEGSQKGTKKTTATTATARSAPNRQRKAGSKKVGDQGNLLKRPNAFTRPLKLTAILAEFMGKTEASRGEIGKKFWEYWKAENLLDKNDKRYIIADTVMLKLFPGESRFLAFSVQKLLKEHHLLEGGREGGERDEAEDGERGEEVEGGGIEEAGM
eukprot:CAMPEP_0175038826 /NCGR_PEP_ID=MMETSP0052_2-20121109/120_1 /TAXON_ID=51329 ORGANISM="Polytomella parva, Strain SAG 63-3" /NCGR_SAMPLE_ID=MMETSP0052_2 /ASSEMBLY_ACC=CAM_ASM_000194 /LENGTH=342 /DNA_ID=CAMNT_0016300363 /DNA_START=232 /DNA_END=1260 /DNA_ORIENTATION=-